MIQNNSHILEVKKTKKTKQIRTWLSYHFTDIEELYSVSYSPNYPDHY